MAPSAPCPTLSFLIPTYNRMGLLERTLRILAADPAIREHRIPLQISDNCSPDGTADLVRSLQAEFPELDLRLYTQPENLGPGSLTWLVEHAPETDYVWTLADDDWPVEGGVQQVLDLLAEHPVDVLHLPHCWLTPAGEVQLYSPRPDELEIFDSSRELFLKYTQWLSFMSATVVRRAALQRAAAEAPTTNPWQPHLWFVVAGRHGRCAVAPQMLVIGDGSGVSWNDHAVATLGRNVVEAYDEGFHLVVDEHEFGRTLDGRYANQRFFEAWAHTPIELLAGAVERFPTSRELRTMLWRLVRATGRRELYPVIDAASHAAGGTELAARHVAEGEACFSRGDYEGAVTAFNAAVGERPTLVDGWNNLGVALHALGRPEATEALDAALDIDPRHADALANRAGLMTAAAA